MVKKLIRNFLIVSLYFLGFSKIRNLIFRLQKKPVTRILAFHDIPDGVLSKFRAKLQFIKKEFKVIGIDDYFDGKNLSYRKINIAITFDDGYKTWINNVLPVLKELDIPATFFVSSGFVELSGHEETDFIRKGLKRRSKFIRGLSWEEVRNIKTDGFTIGGHTQNHVDLGRIRNELKDEILLDKMKIETEIGVTIDYFAFPFGGYRNVSTEAIEMVRNVGYRGSFTIIPGFNHANTDCYLLHRDCLDADMPDIVLRAWLYGTYDGIKSMSNMRHYIMSNMKRYIRELRRKFAV